MTKIPTPYDRAERVSREILKDINKLEEENTSPEYRQLMILNYLRSIKTSVDLLCWKYIGEHPQTQPHNEE